MTKTIKRMAILAFTLTLILSSALSAFALDNGDNVSFTARRTGGGDYRFDVASEGLEGTCCQLNIDPSSSGTASVTRVSNSSAAAKIAYYVARQNNYYANTSIRPSWFDTYGIDPAFKVSFYAENLVQISMQGADFWSEKMDKYGYSQGYINKCVSDYNAIVASASAAPSSFEVWAGDPTDGSQNFLAWRDSPVGKLKLKKSSAIPGITG